MQCGKRFTSYEKIEDVQPMVVKKDGRRERFDPDKIQTGIRKACEKRPISTDQIDAIVAEVERTVQGRAEKEVSSEVIGQVVIDRLCELDGVAYVRFASVYREFRDVNEFLEEIRGLVHPTG